MLFEKMKMLRFLNNIATSSSVASELLHKCLGLDNSIAISIIMVVTGP